MNVSGKSLRIVGISDPLDSGSIISSSSSILNAISNSARRVQNLKGKIKKQKIWKKESLKLCQIEFGKMIYELDIC